MIAVKKRKTKEEQLQAERKNFRMVNIRVSASEHAWLCAVAAEISQASGFAPSISGVFRLLMQEAIKNEFKVKAV